jgi:pimeloyl-ACP methyl ester carboxylesterase
VNVGAYNTVESAADVAALGPALGYEQVNLYGGSYGTTLAMTAMRHHPDVIRSVILDAITPPQIDLMASFAPNLEHALGVVFEECAASASCSTAYPNLEAMFYESVTRYDADPLMLPAVDPETGDEITLPLTGGDIISRAQNAMYDEPLIPMLPLLIAAVYTGNQDVLMQLGRNTGSAAAGLSSSLGTFWAMRCTDDVLTTTPEQWAATIRTARPELQAHFLSSIAGWYDICQYWGAKPLDPVENTAVASDLPTLITSGQYDPVTPAAWGDLAAETLPSSFHYVFPGSAHGVSPTGCAVGIVSAFVDNPTVAPDASCLAQLPDIVFALPPG